MTSTIRKFFRWAAEKIRVFNGDQDSRAGVGVGAMFFFMEGR